MKKTLVITALLMSASAFSQLPWPDNCDFGDFDQVNHYPQSSFEGISGIQWVDWFEDYQGNIPLAQNCWRLILAQTPAIFVDNGYSFFDNVHARFGFHYVGNLDPNITQVDPNGIFGPLYQPLETGENYVAQVMANPQHSIVSDVPAAGVFLNFNTQILPSFSNFPFISLQQELNGDVATFPTNSLWFTGNHQPIRLYYNTEPSGTQVSVVQGWQELNQEFTASGDHENVMMLNSADPILISLDGNPATLSTSVNYQNQYIDDICVVSVSDNPISIQSSIDGTTFGYRESYNLPCGEETTATFHIATSFNGTNTDPIVLELEYDDNLLTFDPAGSNFSPVGLLTFLPGELDQNGIDVSVNFGFMDVVTDGTETLIGLDVTGIPGTGGYLCHKPSIKLTQTYPECIFDFNNDQLITASDLTAFLAIFGTSNVVCGMGDGDGDGSITAADLTDFLAAFGTTCSDGMMISDVITEIPKETWFKTTEILKAAIDNGQIETSDIATIYPNPSDGEYRVESSFLDLLDVSMNIFSSDGRLVKQIDPSELGQIDISNEPSGTYFLDVMGMKISLIKK